MFISLSVIQVIIISEQNLLLQEEEEQRFHTWIENWHKVKKHNLEYSMNKHTYRLEMNHFADMVGIYTKVFSTPGKVS